MKVLSIDIGASSGRFIVVDYDKNKGFSSRETFRFLNGMKRIDNHLRWDFNELINNIYLGLEKTLKEYKDIKTIGVDTWAVDYGLLNKSGDLIALPIGYRDSRCENAAKKLLSEVEYKTIYSKTGIQYLNFNSIFQLYDDITINNLEFETFLMIPDLINYYLTDEKRIELTNLSTTAFYNPNTKKVDEELIEKIGLDFNKIPNIIYPSTRIGSLKQKLIDKYNLYPVEVVSTGSHDTASAVASIKLAKNTAFISMGTWSLMGVELDKPLINEETYLANFTNEIGLEHRVRFLKNITGLFIIQELKKDFEKINPGITFGKIHEEAQKVKGNNIYVDINAPEFKEPGDMLNKFYSFLKRTHQYKKMTLGEIALSIYESMAFKYLEEFNRLQNIINQNIEQICIVGGGIKATLLNQLIANVLNVKVVLGSEEATSFGNALAQFIYLNEFKNLDEAREEFNKFIPKQSYKPQHVEEYKEKYNNYLKIMEKTNMKVTDAKFVKDFIKLCNEGYRKGWHERNGGNLSYRIKDDEIESIKEFLHDGEWFDIGTEVPDLKNEYFLVTGSGKYMMNVLAEPEENICIIKLDETGTKFKIVWGLVNGGRPTSELPSHLMNLEVVKKRTNGEYRIVYHCHATNIIALTFVLPLDNATFTRELWEMATECPVVFPGGVGVVPWMVPGGKDIAIETSKLMKKYDVAIWAHHGIFGTGPDFDTTFGLVDTVEKSAEILVKVLSMTNQKRQTITRDEFIALAKDFNVTLDEDALNCK